MLSSLKKRGLISETEKSGIKYFSAESPERLFTLGRETREKIDVNLTVLTSMLPEFLSLYKSGDVRKPRVRFYEGKKGHWNVYEGILNDKPKELLVLVNYQEFKKLIDLKYEKEWIVKRIALGINLRWLDFDSKEMRLERQDSADKLRQIKFLPNDYKTSGGLFIYQHKLILLSTTEEFMAVVVESSEFAGFGKMIFEVLWKTAGR
jgi:sugar-specific transcriptional regulator TrmB